MTHEPYPEPLDQQQWEAETRWWWFDEQMMLMDRYNSPARDALRKQLLKETKNAKH